MDKELVHDQKTKFRFEQIEQEGNDPTETGEKAGEEVPLSMTRYWLMGQAAGAVKDVQPAADIMNEMIDGAIAIMRGNVGIISRI